MCHFHSVIITMDGKIHHRDHNSHSDIARDVGLYNTTDKREFYEAEWHGRGDMPANLVQKRSYEPTEPEIPSLIVRVAERHYEKLALIVKGELDPHTVEPFNTLDYKDVQDVWNISRAVKFAPQLKAIIDGWNLDGEQETELVKALIEEMSFDIEDIAKEAIEEARKEAEESGSESSYQSGYDDGYSSAGEDMWSDDDVEEKIEEAKKEASEEGHDEGYQEGYTEGFLACLKGAKPDVEYINGMPAFLFK